jgi:hypothetical protein
MTRNCAGSKEHTMSAAELRVKIEQLQSDVAKLTESKAISRQRRAELEAERKRHVMGARLNQDAEAQARLVKIDAELEVVRRDASDDESAFIERSQQLAEAQDNLALAEWTEDRERVIKLLKKRIAANHEERLAAAVDTLLKTFGDLSAEYEAIADELKGLNGLRASADEIRLLPRFHADLISCRLTAIGVPTPINWNYIDILRKRDFGKTAGLAFDRAIMRIGEQNPPVASRAPEARKLNELAVS